MLSIKTYPRSIGHLNANIGLLTLVLAGANAAIYRRESRGLAETPSFDGYEVIAYRESKFKVFTIGGVVRINNRQLLYTSNEDFGKYGYAYRSLPQSMKRFIELEYGGVTAKRYICIR